MLSTNSWITTALIIEKGTGFNANIRAGRMDRRAAPPIVVIPAWGKPVTEWNPAVPPHADFIHLHQFLLPVSIWEPCRSQMLHFLGERGGSLAKGTARLEVWGASSSPQARASSTQPTPAPCPFFGARSCSKRSKPLLLPAALFALSAGQDPPLTSIRMASLRRSRQLSCKHRLNCVHVSLQKPPRLISASIKSLWLLLRLHFLLLDHEK